MPRLITVIPCHNDGAWVGEAIESALTQVYPDHEVVVVDDGSTDNTAAVLARYDGRVRLLTQPQRGPAAARNLGIARSDSEYVAFLDADDRLLRGAHAARVAALARDRRAGLAYGTALGLDAFGRRLPPRAPRRARPDRYLPALFVLRSWWNPSMCVVRRAALEAVGGFDESLALSEDWDLWMRIAQVATILGLRRPVVLRVQRAEGFGRRRELFAAAQAQIADKMLRAAPGLAALRTKRDAAVAVAVGWMHLVQGDPAVAASHFRTAASLDPLNVTAWRLLIATWWRYGRASRARR